MVQGPLITSSLKGLATLVNGGVPRLAGAITRGIHQRGANLGILDASKFCGGRDHARQNSFSTTPESPQSGASSQSPVEPPTVKGLVTLVTGGASGLGKATVERLHRQGAKVALLDMAKSRGDEVVKELGGDAIFTPADITADEEVKAAIEKVKEQYGRLDVIVNAAGVAFAFKIYTTSRRAIAPLDRIQKTVDVNIVGTLNVIRHGLHLMVDNEKDEYGQRGTIINISSIAAYDGQIGQFAYSASKGAIASMTLPLARDLADTGIRVMAVAPGLFETPLLTNLPPKVTTFLNQLVPNPNRFGQPDEFAFLVQHILENRYLNGEVIRLDGALRMPP